MAERGELPDEKFPSEHWQHRAVTRKALRALEVIEEVGADGLESLAAPLDCQYCNGGGKVEWTEGDENGDAVMVSQACGCAESGCKQLLRKLAALLAAEGEK